MGNRNQDWDVDKIEADRYENKTPFGRDTQARLDERAVAIQSKRYPGHDFKIERSDDGRVAVYSSRKR